MRFCVVFAALAVVFASLVPDVANAQATRVENPPDPYVHKVAGVEFPAKVGAFKRGRVTEFNEDGSDAAVGYSMDGMASEITIYVYPYAGRSCDEAYVSSQDAITSRGSRALARDAGLNMPGFALARQQSSSYDVAPGGYGFDHAALVSYLWVGCVPGGEWLVKYRGSYLKSDEAKVSGLAQRLFSQIDWRPLAPRE